jgi:transposase
MLGQKEKSFKTHTAICLDDLVPQNNFYRQVEAKLALSFVRALVQASYAKTLGRPSIDPVVFFKLQLIMFLEGIRSERQLMETVNLNLAHRWYIGYDLDEAVPDHSTLSKIRQRYGLEVFQRFFETIVERCVEAGLVWGKELYFDSTRVQANADVDGLMPRFAWKAKQYLADLFEQDGERGTSPIIPAVEAQTTPGPIDPRGLVDKYNGERLLGPQAFEYERTTDVLVSPTDPDATPSQHAGEKHSRLAYHDHYVVDGGKARIILGVLVTPSSIMDNTPMLGLARWVRFRWHLQPTIAVGDSKFGTIPTIAGLDHDGIRPYLPLHHTRPNTALYATDDFRYDPQRDVYVCPQGHDLPLAKRRLATLHFIYQADPQLCNQCPVKAQCTTSTKGRQVLRSFFQPALDRVTAYRQTEAYKKAMRKRQVWIEPLFGEAKQFHGLRRFRLRGLLKVNIEALLTASGQNIKRLLAGKRPTIPLTPVAQIVQLPVLSFDLPSILRGVSNIPVY